jgi:hypothetical protein
MSIIKYTSNPNHKLLYDVFTDIRLPGEKYKVGNFLNVMLNSNSMGIVEVMSVRKFSFNRMNDSMAYACSGLSASKQNKQLKIYYPNLQDDSTLFHLILRYETKNLAVHEPLLKDWWSGWQDKQQTQITQPTLFV